MYIFFYIMLQWFCHFSAVNVYIYCIYCRLEMLCPVPAGSRPLLSKILAYCTVRHTVWQNRGHTASPLLAFGLSIHTKGGASHLVLRSSSHPLLSWKYLAQGNVTFILKIVSCPQGSHRGRSSGQVTEGSLEDRCRSRNPERSHSPRSIHDSRGNTHLYLRHKTHTHTHKNLDST